MIKEIEAIAKTMIALNNRVYGAILSVEELYVLENAVNAMKKLQSNIDHLLYESTLVSDADINQLIKILLKINELICQLDITINEIHELSTKFVCHYREEWDIIQKNVA